MSDAGGHSSEDSGEVGTNPTVRWRRVGRTVYLGIGEYDMTTPIEFALPGYGSVRPPRTARRCCANSCGGMRAGEPGAELPPRPESRAGKDVS